MTERTIAYLVNEYPKVSHTFIRREIRALERLGFRIQRIALRGWDTALPDRDDQQEQALTHYVLGNGALGVLPALLRALVQHPVRLIKTALMAVRISNHSRDRSIWYHLYYVAEACMVLFWLRRSGATHLHAHFGTNPAELALLTRTLGGPPYSFTAHGPEEFARPMALREKIERSAFAVAISSFGRSQLFLHAAHADWPKVNVVHCGLEASFYDVPAVAPPQAPRLVCVGRLSEEKGQWLLVQAITRLRSRGISCEVVLAGDGPLRKDLDEFVAANQLANAVRITGWISSAQVRAEILAARALILPSFAEGLPVVIMEAMALRRPVITTYVAGIPELVVDQETGWLIPAGSIDALEMAIERCLHTPPERLDIMGTAALKRVLVRHSIDVEARKLAGLIDGTVY